MNENAIEIINISKSYPGNEVLKSVSFNVKKNRIHGFLGANGAGKSTTMKAIVGLIHANHGQIKINSSNRIGYLPEIPPLYENMRVCEYLKFSRDIYVCPHMSKKEQKELYQKSIERTGLKDVEGRLIKNLSKGFKQRVGMASVIVFNPEILIFDEPTVGLDPNSMTQIRELILELKKDHTILLSTHQLHEASLLCDDLTIINQGKIISSGTVEDITTEFFTHKILKVEVDQCSDGLMDFINSKSALKKMTVVDSKVGKNLVIEVSGEEDLRPTISRAILDHGHILYGMQEVKPDLEDIFTRATMEEQ